MVKGDPLGCYFVRFLLLGRCFGRGEQWYEVSAYPWVVWPFVVFLFCACKFVFVLLCLFHPLITCCFYSAYSIYICQPPDCFEVHLKVTKL